MLDSYTCHRAFFGNSGTRVRCAKGTKKIRFFYGASRPDPAVLPRPRRRVADPAT